MMKIKKCTKCGIEKTISEFYKRKTGKFGVDSVCKECKRIQNRLTDKIYREKNKEKISKQKKIYYKKVQKYIKNKKSKDRKEHPEKYILKSIKERCLNKNHRFFYLYGGRGIKYFITEEEIRQLMIRDGYWKMKKPSIDHIDNDGNYTFENCRFIEMSENAVKNKRKPILQFDVNGEFIREWKSIREAERILKINNINKVLNNTYNYAGNFKWKYKNV